MGRKTGSRNLGYFYRAGRGWYAQHEGRMIALVGSDGKPLRNKSTPVAEIKAAHRGIIAAPVEIVNSVTVEEVCNAYLDKAKSDGADKTYSDRADTLFDFCRGLPPRFLNSDEKPTPADRIHKGFGHIAIAQLLPLHIDQWIAAHQGWKRSRRTRIQAVKRALNYGVECGLIPREPGSPLKGYKVPPAIARVTYITPEQEAAMGKATNSAFAIALKVCIRTGARPGCEFAKLTAKHVRDHGERMEWVFAVEEAKTGRQTRKPRTIRITDPEIIGITRRQMEKHPEGPLFRNTKGGPWRRKNLEISFRKAKVRLLKKGIKLDADAVMYSTRHTYAKRVLQGFWTGKQTNIETLARLMGIHPQVCRDHYLQWSESYNEPLWECA